MTTETPRVVITGVGAVGPKSLSWPELWGFIKQGKSALERIPDEMLPKGGLTGHAAGQVPQFPDARVPEPFKAKRLSRQSKLFLLALEQAQLHANLRGQISRSNYPQHVILGLSTTDLGLVAANDQLVNASGSHRASLYTSLQCSPQATTVVAIEYLQHHLPPSVHGYLGRTLSCACASGLDAIGEAWKVITRREADLVISGGADAPLVPNMMAAFCQSHLISNRNHPDTCSRPFDIFADTGLVSEAAACIVVESLEHALRRGARPLLEIKGYGSKFDPLGSLGGGYFPTFEAVREAGGINPATVGHVSAWAPGLPPLDRAEAQALVAWATRHRIPIDALPVYSIKGVIGNPFAAAGPIQVATEVMAAQENVLPPTANLKVPCHPLLDHVKECRVGYPGVGLINSHGAGGGNSSLLVQTYSP